MDVIFLVGVAGIVVWFGVGAGCALYCALRFLSAPRFRGRLQLAGAYLIALAIFSVFTAAGTIFSWIALAR